MILSTMEEKLICLVVKYTLKVEPDHYKAYEKIKRDMNDFLFDDDEYEAFMMFLSQELEAHGSKNDENIG